jgi:hypothetical protein
MVSVRAHVATVKDVLPLTKAICKFKAVTASIVLWHVKIGFHSHVAVQVHTKSTQNVDRLGHRQSPAQHRSRLRRQPLQPTLFVRAFVAVAKAAFLSIKVISKFAAVTDRTVL